MKGYSFTPEGKSLLSDCPYVSQKSRAIAFEESVYSTKITYDNSKNERL